ncbi:hypothetical protein ATJ97_3246 [Georgenia soli]|uniref:Uncharacterized protein n=1 Tax=Georgenia soli TaxID=638953 RepID=A0A2A9EPK3_9MICO|nr:hypothetical protein [Georgenia soli]PFG40713.1 hypothetical protein ATJ97_3246 [Georgenia soli]
MDEWAQRRRDAAVERAELLARRRRGEADRAAAMLRTFAAAARRAGLPPRPLRVQGYGGRGTARTDLTGWYLRGDRTAAVGTDGHFYVLTARLSVLDRLRGTTAAPQEPPLVLGAGGKDGDSVDLSTALTRLLPGWED